jgi:dihydroorotate dehydrogenase
VPLSLPVVAEVLVDAGIPVVLCHNAAPSGGPTQAEAVLHAAKGHLEVIAVGGVSHGHEAQAVLQKGIKAIQIASAVVKEGVGAFTRLKQELLESPRQQEQVVLFSEG